MSKTIGVSLFALVIASSAHAQQIGDVFYIALENHNFTQPGGPGTGSPQQLFGNAAAPYLNSLVTPGNPNAAQVSYASNYVNVFQGGTAVHPSEPNYVWMESGMAGPPPSGPWNDNDPYPNNIVNAPNLSNLLQNKYGTSGWRSYQEDIDLATNSMGQLTNTVLPKDQWTVPLNSLSGTSPAYTNAYNGSDQYNYAAKHDPQVFFTATNGGTTRRRAIPRRSIMRHCSSCRPTSTTTRSRATTGLRRISTTKCTLRSIRISPTTASPICTTLTKRQLR